METLHTPPFSLLTNISARLAAKLYWIWGLSIVGLVVGVVFAVLFMVSPSPLSGMSAPDPIALTVERILFGIILLVVVPVAWILLRYMKDSYDGFRSFHEHQDPASLQGAITSQQRMFRLMNILAGIGFALFVLMVVFLFITLSTLALQL